MNKFSDIEFPFFGLKKIPEEIIYDSKTIYVKIGKETLLLDDKSYKTNNYLDRLQNMRIDNNIVDVVIFDSTSLNLTQLIRSKSKWGVSHTGKIFDLSKKERFSHKCSKIKKIKDNLLWVKGISYPFKFKNIIGEADKFIFACLVYIENTWILYDFTYEYKSNKKIIL